MRLPNTIVGAITSALGRSSVRALLGSVLLVVAMALPAAAANGPADLNNPTVSPTTGTTATPITFTVTFHNAKGTAPAFVRVVVGSQTFPLAKTAGDESWKQGVRYTTTHKLPVGTWSVRFEASDGSHGTLTAAGADVKITKPAPKPTPEPTPKPKPKPDPKPTARPEARVQPKSQPRPEPRRTPRPEPDAPRPTTAPAPTLAPGYLAGPDPLDWPYDAGRPALPP